MTAELKARDRRYASPLVNATYAMYASFLVPRKP
jgi:hypothetical protein